MHVLQVTTLTHLFVVPHRPNMSIPTPCTFSTGKGRFHIRFNRSQVDHASERARELRVLRHQEVRNIPAQTSLYLAAQ